MSLPGSVRRGTISAAFCVTLLIGSLLTPPNGDIFVTDSEANQIKVLRSGEDTGKPDTNQVFAESGLNDPFGIAFYPPGNDPQFFYVANTDGVIRLPYRNGDLKARGPP